MLKQMAKKRASESIKAQPGEAEPAPGPVPAGHGAAG
jgi:hypothetical protein